MKLYELQFCLTHVYGRGWTWSNTEAYESFKAVFGNSIARREFNGKPKDESSVIMTREQFTDLHALSLSLSEDLTVSFRDRLLHKARYLMQSILRYGCWRACADVSNILRGELEQVAPDMLNFQMLRKFKSHKITSDKRVVLKPSRFIVGTHNVLVWKEFMQHLPLFSEEENSEEKIKLGWWN